MPSKDITQTGPMSGQDLQQVNNQGFQQANYYVDTPFLTKKDRKNWWSTRKHDLKGQFDNEYQNDQFYQHRLERRFRNEKFKEAFGSLPNYGALKSMSPQERDAFYIKYGGSAWNYKREQWLQSEEGQRGEYDKEGLLKALVPQPQTPQEAWNERLDEEAVQNAEELTPITNRSQMKKLNKKLEEEARELYPSPEEMIDYSSIGGGLAMQQMAMYRLAEKVSPSVQAAKGIAETFAGEDNKDYRYLRAKYIRDNMKIPENENPYVGITEDTFRELIGEFSSSYNKYKGTRWLPEAEIPYHELYEANKDALNAGLLWRVEHNVNKAIEDILGKRQPNWGGGDDLMHSRARVFFETAGAGVVENLMDFALVPAGLIYGGARSLVTGDNFWETSSYLPSLAHDVANNITGDNAIAFGDGLNSAAANSGYTIGTMATDAALMAIPVNIANKTAKATDAFGQAAKAMKAAKFNKIYGTAASLNFGIIEGTVDALDVREGIIEDARQKAASLPPELQQEFMENAIREANAAYGRTVLEESLVVNAGTLLGLGFYGSLSPKSAIHIKSPKWQKALGESLSQGNKFSKFGLATGRFVESTTKLGLGELLEEYAQGMSSGINTARANANIDNYAQALYYGLGSEYLAGTHIGFMQGLERLAPQAWTEMDPENLTKQVLMSTLLFRGLHMPGHGKTRQQIAADNNTKIGKLWDNIRKFTPIQTGVGQIIADAKAEAFDVENSLQKGYESLMNDDNIRDVMQTQAALVDLGIQMDRALEDGDLTTYQKTAAAFKVAQAVMLANANTRHTRFSHNYTSVLDNRANFDSLSKQEQEEVLGAYLDELQVSSVKELPRERQIEIMKTTAKESLDLIQEAEETFSRLRNDNNLDGVDIRPLVFAEVLNNMAPKTVRENWELVSSMLENTTMDASTLGATRGGLNQQAFDYVLNSYFRQNDPSKRADFLASLKNWNSEASGISKDDISKAMDAILDDMEKTNPQVRSIVKDDVQLTNWRNDLYRQWSDMYQRAKRGEGTLTRKQMAELDKVDKRYAQLGLEKKERHYAQRLDNARNNISGQVSILDEMESSDELGKEGTRAFIKKLDPNGEAQNLAEALAIIDTADALKSAFRDVESDAQILSTMDNIVDRVKHFVQSSKGLLDLSSYGGAVTNAGIAAMLASAIDTVNNAENVTTTETPEVTHTEEELKASISNEGSEEDDNPSPTEGPAPAPIEPSETPAKSKESDAESIEKQAQEYYDKIEKLDDSVDNAILELTMDNKTPEEVSNILANSKSELEKLYNIVPGDALRYEISKAIDRINELQNLISDKNSTEPLPRKKPSRKRVKIVNNEKVDSLRALRKDIIRWGKKRQSLRNQTNMFVSDDFEDFIDTFWNESYKNFEALKDTFGTKEAFIRYFSDQVYNLVLDRNGNPVIDYDEIFRATLGIETEDEVRKRLRKTGELLSFKEWVREYDNSDDVVDDEEVKGRFDVSLAVASTIHTLLSKRQKIWDNNGDLTDANKSVVLKYRGKNVRPTSKSSYRTLTGLVDETAKRMNAEYDSVLSIFTEFLQSSKVPTKESLMREEYERYVSTLIDANMNLNGAAISDYWDGYDQAFAEDGTPEIEPDDEEAIKSLLEELDKPVTIFVKFDSSGRLYSYVTRNRDYSEGDKVKIRTSRGDIATVTIVKYGRSNYPNPLNLDEQAVKSPEQASQALTQEAVSIIEKQNNKKNKTAIQNDVRKGRSEKLQETHKEVLDTLNNDGAYTYVEKGNLHEGDELGFIIGSWNSPDGVRPVVYIVTKKTFEGASNNDQLFKGHQVIGVWDTDSVSEESVTNEINKVRTAYNIGDYFELSQPCVVTDVSSTGVKFKSVIGQAITSETIQNTNLNKLLDNENGTFGMMYDGRMSEATVITNEDGHMQVSDPMYDITRLFDPNASAEENSKRLKDKTKTATLANKVKFLIVPTPSGDTAQLDIRAVDDTIPNYLEYIKNSLSGKVGELIKDSLRDKMVELWRRNKQAKNVASKPFKLSPFFRLNGQGIAVRYFGGKYTFSLGKDTILFELNYDMADIESASNSIEASTKLLDSPMADGRSLIDIAYEQLVSILTDETDPIIHAANISVKDYSENAKILQAQIADGLLYAPNAIPGPDGKLEIAEASFTAYIEGTQPERKVDTKSVDTPVSTSTNTETKPLAEVTEKTSQEVKETPKETSTDTPAGVSLGLIKPKKRPSAKAKPNTNMESTIQPPVPSNAQISTLPYSEAVKYATISISEEEWNSYSGIERLQYLNCK